MHRPEHFGRRDRGTRVGFSGALSSETAIVVALRVQEVRDVGAENPRITVPSLHSQAECGHDVWEVKSAGRAREIRKAGVADHFELQSARPARRLRSFDDEGRVARR